MVKIDFEYRDSYSKDDKWSKQTCLCNSIAECKRFYGLDEDPDCEYRIISIIEV